MDAQLDLLARAGLTPVAVPPARRTRGAARRGSGGAFPAATPVGLFDAPLAEAPAVEAERIAPEVSVAPPAILPPVPEPETVAEIVPDRPSFGTWLLGQRGRRGVIGALIEGARRDPAFPKSGDPDTVRSRLEAVQAEDEVFAAIDAAEREWFCSGGGE